MQCSMKRVEDSAQGSKLLHVTPHVRDGATRRRLKLITITAIVLLAALTRSGVELLHLDTVVTTNSPWHTRAATPRSNQQRGDLFSRLEQVPRAPRLPLFPAYAVNRKCRNNCSELGNCMADLGMCQCPGAWRGTDCSEPAPRPCTNRIGGPGSNTPTSHVDAAGMDLNLTEGDGMHGRCAGVCDLEYGQCYCPSPGKYGRINPPPGSPPGTPAIREGRALGHPCNAPATDAHGASIPWGNRGLTWQALFGPQGWCSADHPINTPCACTLDGWDGPGCVLPTESFCLNQCSRRGVCHQRGFCKCQPGWYGIDCAHPSSAVAAAQPAAAAGASTWLKDASVDAWVCYSTGRGCIEDVSGAVYAAHLLLHEHPSERPSSSSSNSKHRHTPQAEEVGHAQTLSWPRSTTHNRAHSPSRPAQPVRGTVPAQQDARNSAKVSLQKTREGGPATPTLGALHGKGVRASLQSHNAVVGAGTAQLPEWHSADWTAAKGGHHAQTYSRRRHHTAANSSAVAAGTEKRFRPLIYVYNGPLDVNSYMLQYRNWKRACSWRSWDIKDGRNSTDMIQDSYMLECLLPELLMGSRHRTLVPEEADYFFVPVLSSCYLTRVAAHYDFPWFYRPTHHRVKGAAVMYWHALNWIRTHYPYWNASRGADHIWLFAHDEGACWAPKEIYDNSIILSHWGRDTPDNVPSHTQYSPDNYSAPGVAQDDMLPVPYTELIGRHRCYTPGKDLVLPVVKLPSHYASSPYVTGNKPVRDILALHKGRMGTGPDFGPSFSLGVRQAIAREAQTQDWANKHNIHVGSKGSIQGPYSTLLARSVFCLVLQGEGWTARFDDAVLHGCIPVVVIDVAVGPWAEEMDWETFSIRIHSSNITNIPAIIKAVPESVVHSMQQRLAEIWHRFAWLSHPLIAQDLVRYHKQGVESQAQLRALNASKQGVHVAPQHHSAPSLSVSRVQADAFHSLMQILSSWIPRRGAHAARVAIRQLSRAPT